MSPIISSPRMRNQASQLRRNQTTEEKLLWSCLHAHKLANLHFRRQYAIGNYIVDFCAPRKKLIIELDGQPHVKSFGTDTERMLYLQSKGYLVIRFWNHELVNNLENVLKIIEQAAKSR